LGGQPAIFLIFAAARERMRYVLQCQCRLRLSDKVKANREHISLTQPNQNGGSANCFCSPKKRLAQLQPASHLIILTPTRA
jgi:hypothetical protein